jgi:hypothetical protein
MNEEKWKKSWAIKLDYELFLNSVKDDRNSFFSWRKKNEIMSEFGH